MSSDVVSESLAQTGANTTGIVPCSCLQTSSPPDVQHFHCKDLVIFVRGQPFELMAQSQIRAIEKGSLFDVKTLTRVDITGMWVGKQYVHVNFPKGWQGSLDQALSWVEREGQVVGGVLCMTPKDCFQTASHYLDLKELTKGYEEIYKRHIASLTGQPPGLATWSEAEARNRSRLREVAPIATLVVNGHEEPVYDVPLGLEHLFQRRRSAHSPVQLHSSSKRIPTARSKRTIQKKRTYERSRRSSRPLSFTLSLGDIEGYETFLRTRFIELTMGPLRGIVTEWVKVMEPDRQSKYGPYHNGLPGDHSWQGPPWWPRHIAYTEPCHLKKDALVALAIELMLLHRIIDEKKRRNGSWIDKLEQRATEWASVLPDRYFSGSTNPQHVKKMRERALNDILPNLFHVARSHENHLAKYGLYEGFATKLPDCVEHIQWHCIPKPFETSESSSKPTPDAEGSGHDTEVDANINSCNTAFQSSFAQLRAPLGFSPATSHPPVAQQAPLATTPAFAEDCDAQGPASTFHSSLPCTAQWNGLSSHQANPNDLYDGLKGQQPHPYRQTWSGFRRELNWAQDKYDVTFYW